MADWGPEIDSLLRSLVKDHVYDWDKVAADLQT